MSWNINRVVIIGRLSNDVELKHIPSGTAVAHFNIAVGGKSDKDGKDTVSFFNVVVWGTIAENCAKYLSKGKLVCIDGALHQRSWKAQDGSNRSVVEIVAERVEFLSPMQSGQPAKQAQPEQQGQEDGFYDNTGFDPTPIDPGFYDNPDNF